MALSFVGTEVRNPVVAQEVEEPTADPRPLRARLKRVGMNGRYAGMKPIQNPGQKVARAPLTPWETYAQALLFTNEASYVN